MLAVMDIVNPNFHPVPLPAPVETGRGHKHLGEPLTNGFVRRDDSAFLYKCSSEALHTLNPYRESDARFQRLLSWHCATLLTGDRGIVSIPCEGSVHVYPATPTA